MANDFRRRSATTVTQVLNRRRLMVMMALTVTCCGVFSGCSADSAEDEMQKAQDECRDLEPTGSLITFYSEDSAVLTVRATDKSFGEEIPVFDCLLKALGASDADLSEFWDETFSFAGSHTAELPNGIEAYWNLEDDFIGYFSKSD